MSVTIFELSDLNEYNENDVLFVSRRNDQAGKGNEIYESYKYKLSNLHNVISNDVFNRMSLQVYNWEQQLKEFNNDKYKELSANFEEMYEDHLSKCNILHNKLSTEWRTLSTTLCADYENFKKWVKEQLSGLDSKTDQTDFDREKNNLSNEIQNLKNELNGLSTWVSKNFVDITSNQTINGTKTFTNVIKGIAEKAQWA